MTDELAAKVKESDFAPDYIIGITTGGLIPLYFLSKKLDVENILTISASSYHKEEKGDLRVTYLPNVDLKDKKILLVDEIVETFAIACKSNGFWANNSKDIAMFVRHYDNLRSENASPKKQTIIYRQKEAGGLKGQAYANSVRTVGS